MKNTAKTFEENMERLEQIVRAMEQGNVPLDESLKLFQEGTALVSNCAKMLDQAQLQIKKMAIKVDGSLVQEDLEIEL